jgi:hypothetical protein
LAVGLGLRLAVDGGIPLPSISYLPFGFVLSGRDIASGEPSSLFTSFGVMWISVVSLRILLARFELLADVADPGPFVAVVVVVSLLLDWSFPFGFPPDITLSTS